MFSKEGLEYAENLLEAVNAAAARAQNAWLFFLGVTAFLFITISSVTHTTLLLDTPVRLPLFQVNMRAYAFFLVAPVIYVFVHLGVLVQHRTMRAKLEEFNRALQPLGEEQTRQLRLRLSIYTYVQFMAGGERGGFAFVVAIIAWLTLVVMPLLLLAYFQASFLPYHSNLVTWANRLTLTADAIAILLVGLFRLRLREPGEWRRRISSMQRGLRAFPRNRQDWSTLLSRLPRATWKGLRARLSGCPSVIAMLNATFVWLAVFYAFLMATIPGDAFDRLLCGSPHVWCRSVPWDIVESAKDEQKKESQRVGSAWFITPAYGWREEDGSDGTGGGGRERYAFLPTAWLFERGVDRVSGLSNSPLGLARNLIIITNTVLNREGRVSLRGRDLRYATLTHVILRHADFTGADLTHADLSSSDLTAARLGCADTGRKKRLLRRNESGETWEDKNPQVQCTNLLHAELDKARLDGATFSSGDAGERQPLARDAGKDGVEASPWPSIDLSGTSLVGAHFNKIVLQGWNFDEADLTAAIFKNVDASFASFRSADLRGATFEDSTLTATDFSPALSSDYRTFLEGVIFSNTRMPFADFFQVTLWRTSLPDWDNDSLHSALEFATFEGAKIIKPTPDENQILREWVKGLKDSRLQRRVRDALKPLLEEAPWTGRDRKLWEALIAPLDGGSTAPVAQRLQARLQFIRKRTEMLAKDYCTERATWMVWRKVEDISVVLVGYYKPDGEAAVPEEPENADQSSENGKNTRDEHLSQRLRQVLAAENDAQKATQPEQEENTELPPLGIFDPEVFNEHCGNRNEKTRLDKEDLIRRWQGWINHLKKAAK